MQELDEQVAAHRVGCQQGLVEQERRALAATTEHLTECEPQEERDLVAGAMRHSVERHHVGAFPAEQAEREVIRVDVDLDVSRPGQQAEPVAEGIGEPRRKLAMRHPRRGLDQVGGAVECLELAQAAVTCGFARIELILEVRDRRERVEHAPETGAQLAGLVARRCRRAPSAFGLEIECLQARRRRGFGRERLARVTAALHQLLGQRGLEALERGGVATEREDRIAATRRRGGGPHRDGAWSRTRDGNRPRRRPGRLREYGYPRL